MTSFFLFLDNIEINKKQNYVKFKFQICRYVKFQICRISKALLWSKGLSWIQYLIAFKSVQQGLCWFSEKIIKESIFDKRSI